MAIEGVKTAQKSSNIAVAPQKNNFFAVFAYIINISAKNYQNIKKFMTIWKNFSKAAIWDQSRLSSSICLEVMIIWTQTWYLIFNSFTHLGLFFFAWRGLLWPRMCGMVHPHIKKEGGHDIDIPW